MNIMQFIKTLLMAAVLLSPLAAEESTPAQQCDAAYDACLEKCEKAEDGSEKCYQACEKTYDECLALAQKSD